MPKWTYHLTVINELKCPLKLLEPNIAWGRKEKFDGNFPDVIQPGTFGKYYVYSPAGTSTGIEFYLSFQDKAPAGEHSLGTVQVKVDMPYWKHKNTSSCETTGMLEQSGFQEVPDGGHDFSTTVTIYEK